MSRFKPGDKVRALCDLSRWLFEGSIYEVLQNHPLCGISLVDNPDNGNSFFDETKLFVYSETCFELATPSTPQEKSYTLTPYIKPKTVTMDGVEYLVTENV